MTDNIIKSTDVNTKSTGDKPVVKKVTTVKKVVKYKEDAYDGDGDGMVQDGTIHEREAKSEVKPKVSKKKNERDFDIAVAQPGYKFIYFSSGSGYVTPSGYQFSQEQRIHQIPTEEADHLLTLDNFRLPDQLELEELAEES